MRRMNRLYSVASVKDSEDIDVLVEKITFSLPPIALKSQFAPSPVVDGSSSEKGKPLSEKNDHE